MLLLQWYFCFSAFSTSAFQPFAQILCLIHQVTYLRNHLLVVKKLGYWIGMRCGSKWLTPQNAWFQNTQERFLRFSLVPKFLHHKPVVISGPPVESFGARPGTPPADVAWPQHHPAMHPPTATTWNKGKVQPKCCSKSTIIHHQPPVAFQASETMKSFNSTPLESLELKNRFTPIKNGLINGWYIYTYIHIWGFPKMLVPNNHGFY